MSNFWQNLILNTSQLLSILGLRKSQTAGGIVYDSTTKQPIDPAMVKLIDVQSGKVLETCTTDIEGRYGFLNYPGKFQIFVHRTNYIFPSQKISGYTDSVYNNIYHGELFELTGGSDVIAFNIPLDPEKPDWNQQEKLQTNRGSTSPFARLFIHSLVKIFFWFGCIVAIYFAVQNHSKIALWILAGYLGLIILANLLPKSRQWGRLKTKTGEPLDQLVLEASPTELPDMVTAKALVHGDGKFFLRLQAGSYDIKIKRDENILKIIKIKVSKPSVVTQEIII